MKIVVVLALVCAGCALHEIRASPSDLEAARVLLREGKPALVRTQEDGMVPVQPDQKVAMRLEHGQDIELPLDAIMRDCPDRDREDGRLCEFHGVQHVTLATRRKVHPATYGVPIAIGLGGVLMGGLYCASECSGGAKIATQAGLAGLGALILYTVLTHGFG